MLTRRKKREAIPRVQTNLNLPMVTRDKIEKLARQNYSTLTEVIVAAIDQYTQETKKD